MSSTLERYTYQFVCSGHFVGEKRARLMMTYSEVIPCIMFYTILSTAMFVFFVKNTERIDLPQYILISLINAKCESREIVREKS